jgi:F0F1-type ATP synthase assembly protein I
MRTGITAYKGSILSDILAFSAWGFVIVAGSLLFFRVGLFIDEQLRTEPYFMFGLFFLAIILTIGRLWQKAFKVKERLKARLIPENEWKALRDLSKTGISLGRRQ